MRSRRQLGSGYLPRYVLVQYLLPGAYKVIVKRSIIYKDSFYSWNGIYVNLYVIRINLFPLYLTTFTYLYDSVGVRSRIMEGRTFNSRFRRDAVEIVRGYLPLLS